jgi:hypothetical protein
MRGFAEQVLHYFDRPTGSRPLGSVGGPAAWTGETVGDAWRDALTAEQVDELGAAVTSVVASGVDLGTLSADDVALASLDNDIQRWRHELAEGRGFVLVQGFPVQQWTLPEAEAACWIVGLLLGEPGAQNLEGDLLGHVRDIGPELAHADERLYRTNHAIRFHCDAADVVGLFCRSTSRRGGASRLVSSVAVHDLLQAEQPALADHLFDEISLDTRRPPDAGLPVVPVTPAAFDGEQLRTFMHLDYFTSVERHDGIELDPLTRDTLAAWEEIAERRGVHLDMQLAPGDLQLVSNHVVVHARTAYEDDPASPRDLLRLWLSLDR